MKWIIGLLCLFFLVIFHEFGHFLAAKLFGVKVESFSVGWGPVLLHKKIGDTDYRLSLLPLGGYCGMKGEQDFQKAIENNQKQIEAEPDSMYGVHPIKRALIGFAGPFFNFVFAFIAFSFINGIGYNYYSYSNKIIIPDENNTEIISPAREAGLITGDRIIRINNKEIECFSDLIQEVSTKPDEDINVLVERNSTNLEFIIHSVLNKEDGTGKIGIMADTSEILQLETKHYSFFGAIIQGFIDCFDYIKLTFKSIRILLKGVDITNAVSGPARVTDMLGTTVQSGFKAGVKIGTISLLSLMGLISISLFIMNLLPIPVLDGGIILIALIEVLIRRKINPKIQYYIQFIGIAFIAIMFIIGLSVDITYFIKGTK